MEELIVPEQISPDTQVCTDAGGCTCNSKTICYCDSLTICHLTVL